jgi:hypothetical protein
MYFDTGFKSISTYLKLRSLALKVLGNLPSLSRSLELRSLEPLAPALGTCITAHPADAATKTSSVAQPNVVSHTPTRRGSVLYHYALPLMHRAQHSDSPGTKSLDPPFTRRRRLRNVFVAHNAPFSTRQSLQNNFLTMLMKLQEMQN